MKRQTVTLDDKYLAPSGKVFMTGIQALVRLPLDRKRMDQGQGLNTAGFISGYRGSPLGGYDQQLAAAKKHLDTHNIKVWEGLNEDLAATAVWGSQQAQAFPGALYDGVFGLWYGKAPGVDRTGDVFKHANMAGVDPKGGVLAVAGDDPLCKSSTLPSQSEFAFIDAEIPVLAPASIQEVLDYGLIGWEISRRAGVWTGLIALADTMDAAAVVDVSPERLNLDLSDLPLADVHLRAGDTPMEKERRLREVKLPLVQEIVRRIGLDQTILASPRPRLGVIVSGQASRDVFEALLALGVSSSEAASLGLSIFKVGMTWPLEPTAIRDFCRGLDRVLVIEHKRAVIEPQLKSVLYDLPDGQRPVIEGKRDREGRALFRDTGTLSIAEIATVLANRLLDPDRRQRADAYLRQVAGAAPAAAPDLNVRKPHFCSGCPHNTSTKVPDGSRALAGIGCHYMATFEPERRTDMHTQMGGEGLPWVGAQHFTSEKHVFANLGDGTYSHSGSLAVRAAVSGKANITYKILYNDAVAMTGGQHVESGLTVPQIVQQMQSEGVARTVVVADDVSRYASVQLPRGVTVHHRSRMDQIQRELRETPGVTILIYDQVCASEKRRRIKRGKMAAPVKRAFINTAVCEGCGDCSVKSNCLSVEPVETEYGRKRQINQSTCNTDYSCLEGFCPSFVTVTGGDRKSDSERKPPVFDVSTLPSPELPALDRVYNIVFTGVGGTGVTTVAAVLGMAAHLDGRAAQTLDKTGLAQKGGPVVSHVRIAAEPSDIKATQTPPGAADAVIACDMVVAGSGDALVLFDKARTGVAVNRDIAPTAEFITNRNVRFSSDLIAARLRARSRQLQAVDAESLAEDLCGDAIYANMIMLGAAWQMGLVPVSAEAILEANRLNGAKVGMNAAAFDIGRLAIASPDSVRATIKRPAAPQLSLDEVVARRAEMLEAYQDAAYAEVYRAALARVRAAEENMGLGHDLSLAVAKNLAKLMAYKDEYEVARLYADPAYKASLEETFGKGAKLTFLLAPPLISKRNAKGELQKHAFGGWMMPAFRVLAKLKGLRKTAFDPIGWTGERKMERRLRDEYLARIDMLVEGLAPEKHALAVEIASIPDEIRGYGHVKDRSVETAEKKLAALLGRWRSEAPEPRAPLMAAE